MVNVAGDDYGYWRQIRARWRGTDDLVVVEQDIEIGRGTVVSLAGCPEPWCVFGYTVFGDIPLVTGLGCTKIGAVAQRAVPAEAVEARFAGCVRCRGAGCWWHIDQVVGGLLRRAGLSPHVHGTVRHLHEYGKAARPVAASVSPAGAAADPAGGVPDRQGGPRLRAHVSGSGGADRPGGAGV